MCLQSEKTKALLILLDLTVPETGRSGCSTEDFGLFVESGRLQSYEVLYSGFLGDQQRKKVSECQHPVLLSK